MENQVSELFAREDANGRARIQAEIDATNENSEISKALRADRIAKEERDRAAKNAAEDAEREDLHVMSYRSDLTAGEMEAVKAQIEANNARAWYKFSKYQQENPTGNDVVICDAAFQRVLEYFQDEPLSVDKIIEAVPHISGLPRESSGEAKSKLIQTYLELCPGSPELKNNLASRLRYQSLPEIQAAVDSLVRARQLRGATVPELKQIIKQARQEERLPEQYTAASLKAMDGPSLRRVMTRWGSNLVTERLNQK